MPVSYQYDCAKGDGNELNSFIERAGLGRRDRGSLQTAHYAATQRSPAASFAQRGVALAAIMNFRVFGYERDALSTETVRLRTEAHSPRVIP